MRGRGKNLNSRLAESELKYHSIFNHSFDGILLTAPDGRILAANPAGCSAGVRRRYAGLAATGS
jgi:PAS domain-containing protein